jgi:hypothetical protein
MLLLHSSAHAASSFQKKARVAISLLIISLGYQRQELCCLPAHGLYKTFMNYLCLSYVRQSSIEVVDNLSAEVAPVQIAE